MKKIMTVVSWLTITALLAMAILLFTGCSWFTSSENKENGDPPDQSPGINTEGPKKTVKIGWQYYNYIKKEGTDVNGQSLEYPYTDIYQSTPTRKPLFALTQK